MATRKTRLVIAFVLMLSLVSFFSIPASVFAEDPIVDASTTYTVSYNHGGPAHVNYAAGTVVTVGAIVPGYTGWKLNGNDTDLGMPLGTIYMPGTTFVMPANAVNFKAYSGESNAFNVTYDGNGNTGGTEPIDEDNPYLENTFIHVMGPGTLSLTGYKFTCWNTSASGLGTNYDPGDHYKMLGDVTFYAQWEYVPVPGLAITKEVNKTTVSAMDASVIYTLKITNTGDFDLINIKLNDTLLHINDLAIPSLSPGAFSTTDVAFDLGDLSPGDWHSNVFTNVASVSAEYYNQISTSNIVAEHSRLKDIGPVTASAIVTYIPPVPGLTFTKTVDPTIVNTMGAIVNYTFTVTNTGDFDLRDIEIDDELLNINGLEIPDLYVGDPLYTTTVAFDLGDLDPGDWSGNTFTNIASVTADWGAVLELTLLNHTGPIVPIQPVIGGQLGPITASAMVTYIPGTLTINKIVPEVTDDTTLFTFVVTKVVNDTQLPNSIFAEDASYTTTVAVSENSPYTIYGLPQGSYRVVEQATPTYYTISGSDTQNVDIGPSEENSENSFVQSITFTNNYYVPPTTTTTTTTRRSNTTPTIPEEPTPAGPVVVPVIDEPVPAAPLPKTGGLDPSFLYGLGALLAGSGLVIKRKKK